MQPKLSSLIFILLAALAFVLPAGRTHAQNQQPTNVGLVYFIAETHPNGVQLTWETASELNAAGFTLHRRTGSSGDFVYLENIGFIDAEGGPATGYIYQVVDETAVLGQTYTYRLKETEYNSQVIDLADATITVGATPTPTPTATATATATSPSNPVNPIPATATPTSVPTTRPTTNPTTIFTLPTMTPISSASSATQGPSTVTPTSPSQSAATPAGNAAQPTAVLPTPTAQSVTNTASQTAANPTQSAAPDRSAVALAQEAESPTAVGSENYPSENLSGDGAPGAEQPPADQPQTIDNPEPTPLTVIGSETAYDAPGSPASSASSSQTTDNRSTLFLWLGFIVALLIFITGVVGSIILYTRRAR
jgi:hypothetical protein